MTKANAPVDAAKLSLLLNELRLPAIKALWAQFAEQADKEGWPAARFSPPSPSMNWPNATAAESNVILPMGGSCRERLSTPLPSRPCR